MQSMNNLVEVSSTHSSPSGEKTDGDARRKIKTKRLRETMGVAKAWIDP